MKRSESADLATFDLQPWTRGTMIRRGILRNCDAAVIGEDSTFHTLQQGETAVFRNDIVISGDCSIRHFQSDCSTPIHPDCIYDEPKARSISDIPQFSLAARVHRARYSQKLLSAREPFLRKDSDCSLPVMRVG